MNSIFTRRSVRNFLDKEVEQDKIDKLLRAAMQAPSAGNQQPWEFVVVTGRENLDKLSEFNPYAGSLKLATLGIIVMGSTLRMKMPDYWQQDLGAATQNILLQATEMGLGSVWYGCAPEKDRIQWVQEFCELDATLLPYSVIGLGYPKDDEANKFVDRFEADRVHYLK